MNPRTVTRGGRTVVRSPRNRAHLEQMAAKLGVAADELVDTLASDEAALAAAEQERICEGVDLQSVRERLHQVGEQLCGTFVNRTDAVEMILLAHLAAEHFILVGDPGTAKTAIVTCFHRHVQNARVFRTTLGAFTTPEKIFGPLDIEAFKQGRYEHVTDRMLPWADLSLLDEYLKTPDGAANEMLTQLNEREYEGRVTPLHTCAMATNWPEFQNRSDKIAALYDRTLLRLAVDDLTDEKAVARMLRSADTVASYRPQVAVTMDELRAAHVAAMQVRVEDRVCEELARVRGRLIVKRLSGGDTAPGIQISSRRLGKLQNVLRASAWLAGRDRVTVADFAALRFGLWNDRGEYDQAKAVLDTIDTELLRKAMSALDNATKALTEAERQGGGPATAVAVVNRVVEVVHAAAIEARDVYNGPMLTERSREELLKAINLLKAKFEAHAARARAAGNPG